MDTLTKIELLEKCKKLGITKVMIEADIILIVASAKLKKVFNPVMDWVIVSKLVPILFNCPIKAFLSKITLSNVA
jgi:hypothetical protein